MVIYYFVYILLFYILLPLLISVLQGNNFGGTFLFVLILVIAPILSFYIPATLFKIYYYKSKLKLYIFHIITVLLIPVVYLLLIVYFAFSHIQIG